MRSHGAPTRSLAARCRRRSSARRSRRSARAVAARSRRVCSPWSVSATPRPARSVRHCVEHLLEPLDLHRDRRLREVELRRGAGDAAEVVDRDEGAQRGEIEVAVRPGSSVAENGCQSIDHGAGPGGALAATARIDIAGPGDRREPTGEPPRLSSVAEIGLAAPDGPALDRRGEDPMKKSRSIFEEVGATPAEQPARHRSGPAVPRRSAGRSASGSRSSSRSSW